jgi:hypothetical protein
MHIAEPGHRSRNSLLFRIPAGASSLLTTEYPTTRKKSFAVVVSSHRDEIPVALAFSSTASRLQIPSAVRYSSLTPWDRIDVLHGSLAGFC